MTHGFRLVETSVELPSKHDMFLVCSKTPIARVWKPMSSHLEVNYAFMTCH